MVVLVKKRNVNSRSESGKYWLWAYGVMQLSLIEMENYNRELLLGFQTDKEMGGDCSNDMTADGICCRILDACIFNISGFDY